LGIPATRGAPYWREKLANRRFAEILKIVSKKLLYTFSQSQSMPIKQNYETKKPAAFLPKKFRKWTVY
jgi:hypothetical protein